MEDEKYEFKVGERKIRQLRQSATEQMGERWKKTLERELPGELERELPGGDDMFQVRSPRVPPDNLAMPRPTQCRRGLRRSFCRKNSGRGL